MATWLAERSQCGGPSAVVGVQAGGSVDSGNPTIFNYSGLTTLSATRSDMPLTVSSHMGVYDFFKGDIDDVRFYSRALKPEEILELYAHPNLLIARTPPAGRTEEERTDLKRFFREHRAVDFIPYPRNAQRQARRSPLRSTHGRQPLQVIRTP